MTECCVKTLDTVRIREDFPALKEVVYLNVGTYGIMPEPALAATLEGMTEFERFGFASKGNVGGKAHNTRQRLAALLGVAPEDIAMTSNASDGNNLALGSLEWQPGDEIISANEEHPSLDSPLKWLEKNKGVIVHHLPVSPRPEVMLPRLEGVWNPKTRLVAMSHVTCCTGARLPAREITTWAKERGILTHFDGAQALGVFSVDVREIGCDFYASNGHKWLLGPKGTGVFYAPRSRLAMMAVGALEAGTRAWGLYAGLGASLDWYEGLGWANVHQHIAYLSGYLKERVMERPYLHLHTPRAFEESSGLTSFTVAGHEADEVFNRLRERWNIYTRVVPEFNAVRVATAVFNNEEDVQRLMEALEVISRQ